VRKESFTIDPAFKSLKPFALSPSKGQSFGSFDKLSPNGVETSWGRINGSPRKYSLEKATVAQIARATQLPAVD
jgi:hypothetical protein